MTTELARPITHVEVARAGNRRSDNSRVVDRQDIANQVNALLLANDNPDVQKGILLLAVSLGCVPAGG